VLDVPSADWRTRRRESARSDIVAAAWELAREHGIAGLSLRDLGRRVGLAAPSLYSYFDSKNALYDAMFADGWRSLLDLGPPPPATDLRAALRNAQRMYLEWALADPVRYQLLNQRTIPGFEPSPESYDLAKQAYALGFDSLEQHARLTQRDRDLVTAMVAGLINQQIANDPGGTRWVRLLDDVIDLLTIRLQGRTANPTSPRARAAPEEDR
jgi:AcrR family transcriptional regulator